MSSEQRGENLSFSSSQPQFYSRQLVVPSKLLSFFFFEEWFVLRYSGSSFHSAETEGVGVRLSVFISVNTFEFGVSMRASRLDFGGLCSREMSS